MKDDVFEIAGADHVEESLLTASAVDVDELVVGFGAVEHGGEHCGLRQVRAGIGDESMVESDFTDCRAVPRERCEGVEVVDEAGRLPGLDAERWDDVGTSFGDLEGSLIRGGVDGDSECEDAVMLDFVEHRGDLYSCVFVDV